MGAYFDPKKLEVYDNILFVPSDDVIKAKTIKVKTRESYRLISQLQPSGRGQWDKFIIRKSELAAKLIEKFEEINRYIR